MAQFNDLPLELLPVILSFIPNPRSLTRTCLVNKIFYQFAIPKLYERISMYAWHKHGKERVIQLFIVLAEYPRLAEHVRRLEIRDFPKSISFGTDPTSIVIRALSHCTNLRSCTWTRDGSLNTEILQALSTCCKELEELEINGHSEGNYDPNVLLGFARLKKIGLIMPGGGLIRHTLGNWIGRVGETLRYLSLVCKMSPKVTDQLLENLSPSLCNLDYFYITGCPKVTERGITAVLSANETGIEGLGLEGLAPKFHMANFRTSCQHHAFFRRLRTLTLTVHNQVPLEEWTREVSDMLSSPSIPLESFQIYSTGSSSGSLPSSSSLRDVRLNQTQALTRFWSDIVFSHPETLKRISVHRMSKLISMDAIEGICRTCRGLEELFVVMEPGSLHQLASRCLTLAPNLRYVHVNYPLQAQLQTPSQGADAEEQDSDPDPDTIESEFLPVLSPQDALAVIQYCSDALVLFGCNTRVWRVQRQVEIDEEGKPVGVGRELVRYDGQDIPEAFLVVRT